MKRVLTLGTAITLAMGGLSAPAQSQGGLGSLLGSVAPDIGSVGASNAAGVLSYCVKQKLVSGLGATSVLGQLTGQPGVKSSDGFKQGEGGLLKSDDRQFSLDSVKGKVKTGLCNMVLKHAKSFL